MEGLVILLSVGLQFVCIVDHDQMAEAAQDMHFLLGWRGSIDILDLRPVGDAGRDIRVHHDGGACLLLQLLVSATGQKLTNDTHLHAMFRFPPSGQACIKHTKREGASQAQWTQNWFGRPI